MKQRAMIGGKAGKAGGRGTKNHRTRSTTVRAHSSSPADLRKQLDQATTELAEARAKLADALEQQTATSEVLQVISSSPGELKPVFESMLENAVRICEASFGFLYRCEGRRKFATSAHRGASPKLVAMMQGPFAPHPDSMLGRILATKAVVHVADANQDPAYMNRVPIWVAAVEEEGMRSLLAVPLMHDDTLVGALVIFRRELRAFGEKQIALVKNFAAQAVIAIENARLLSELRESLEQQTATAEVLSVISSSPGDLQPVFQSMLGNATRICEAKFGSLVRFDGKVFHFAAEVGMPLEYVEFQRQRGPFLPVAGGELDRVMRTKKVSHTADAAADGVSTPSVRLGGARSTVNVPMLKENELVGVIGIYRQEVRPFTDKQIELLTSFAAQAVIAIENTRLLNELRQRTNDLTESLEQQTATSEVLKVISSSPGELQPVFQAMLSNATRICEASFGVLNLNDHGALRVGAMHSVPPAFAEFLNKGTYQPLPESLLDRVIRTKKTIHVEDNAAEPASRAAILGDARSTVCVPMLKDDVLIGTITIYRKDVRPFADKQIALVTNFAAQAVIAIENTRLLNELRQRTADLTESLEQQTASSEVLSIISRSPGELTPVFEGILANATRICRAKFGALWMVENDGVRLGALYGATPGFADVTWKTPFIKPGPQSATGRVLATKEPFQIRDLAAEPGYASNDYLIRLTVDVGGGRSLVAVPMLKETELIGAIVIFRQEVEPFTEKQIALVQSFAAQAVIAIENARLLNELRESLDRQTATADILRVIADTPEDSKRALDTIAETAVRMFNATNVVFRSHEGERLRVVAAAGPSGARVREALPDLPFETTELGVRSFLDNRQINIDDRQAGLMNEPGEVARVLRDLPMRSQAFTPLSRQGTAIGVMIVTRGEVRPFQQAELDQMTGFAAQAVIAIENARLLNELRESLQQQTATADVLKVISRSTFDLQTVLNTLVESAARLCEADTVAINGIKGSIFQLTATYGYTPEFYDQMKSTRFEPSRGSIAGRVLLDGDVVQITDVLADAEFALKEAAKVGGVRTMLGVPLLRQATPIGVMVLARKSVRPFSEKQVELLSTFADQAVIAIENARLFEAEQQRTTELAKSLKDLRTTQDRLVQTQKLASLGQLTAGIAHEIKNPLNFVNNFSGVSVELIDELEEALGRVTADGNTRQEIVELADTLRDNLDKITQHGKRADAIVKNMLLHSREGSGEHRSVDINTLVEESLNLAYHGARAEKQGFNITLERSFDPAAGEADVYPQEISRVLINLISNGFYAATKRQGEQAKPTGNEPTLTAATLSLGDRVEIRIRDNGTGIPPEVREKIFNPFFTTKPAGEGTGLGLSISYDIIVKQHSGSIEVDTEPGEFTEFRIILPRTAA